MRQLAVAIVGRMLTAVYWWIVFTIVYASVLFGGDRNLALQPVSDHEALIKAGVTIAVGVLVYAVLMVLWQRVKKKLKRAA